MDPFLPEIVTSLNFDQILSFVEESNSIPSENESYEKDFNAFQSFLFTDDDNVLSSSSSDVTVYSQESEPESQPLEQKIVKNFNESLYCKLRILKNPNESQIYSDIVKDTPQCKESGSKIVKYQTEQQNHRPELVKYGTESQEYRSRIVKNPNQSQESGLDVVKLPSHVKRGVINFSLSKIMDDCDNFKQEILEEKGEPPNCSKSSSQPLCTVCSKPALKYSSYGGLACTSCRSFFRRSARDNIYEKYRCTALGKCESKKFQSGRICQLCRFNKCIRAGMRITWVLSQQERERRFVKNKSRVKMTKNLIPCFTVEEKLVLGNISDNFEFPWLENFFIYNQEAAKNLLGYTFCGRELHMDTWKYLGESMLLSYSQTVMPKFRELVSEISNSQFHTLCLHAVPLFQFFRCCFAMRLPAIDSSDGSKPYLESIETQVTSLLKYQDIYNKLDLDLIESLSRIQIFDENSVHVVTYESLFKETKNYEKILKMVRKVQKWPQKANGKYIPHLISLMCIILAFSVINVLNDVSGKIVEKIQLHYTITLQRYLKSHFNERVANEKFLEAMLLIADLQERKLL